MVRVKRGALLSRRHLLLAFAASPLACDTLLSHSHAQEETAKQEDSDELVTPKTKQAIERGLRFLADQQHSSGHTAGAFGTRGYGKGAAVCSLAGLAMMASGDTPGRGHYGEAITRCVEYITGNTQANGLIVVPGTQSRGGMYGHGFATLFLAEVYGMSSQPGLRDTLAKAVKLILAAQNTQGGWRYDPVPPEPPKFADLSVTVCQVMALRAAKNAGIFVPAKAIDRCTSYVKRSQNLETDGGFRYTLEGGASAFPRSAAGAVALQSAGIYQGEEIERGIAYLQQEQFVPIVGAPSRAQHFFYGHYYACQAMWHVGGEDWHRWYRAIRDVLLDRQQDGGSWSGSSIGVSYATAMALIILQMPKNYLPIFQR